MKKAFTLSEVLITLGIIGVVAAITIPSLMAKYQQRSNVIQWRKDFSMLAQAVKQMQADEVLMNSSDYSSQDDFEYAIATKLSYYMKLGNICHSKKYVEEGCSPEAYPIYRLNGSVYTSDLGKWGGGASCATFLSGGLMCFDAYITLIDVNGYSKPNTVGKDVFFALIDFDNMVINPAKGYRTGWGPADGVKVTFDKGDGTCQNSDYGAGCSYYYMHNMP